MFTSKLRTDSECVVWHCVALCDVVTHHFLRSLYSYHIGTILIEHADETDQLNSGAPVRRSPADPRLTLTDADRLSHKR